eukprot:5563427-Prymnesium_polylepis.2
MLQGLGPEEGLGARVCERRRGRADRGRALPAPPASMCCAHDREIVRACAERATCVYCLLGGHACRR